MKLVTLIVFCFLSPVLLFAAEHISDSDVAIDTIEMPLATLIINQSDTVVFNFSLAICNSGYVEVPVSIASDDTLYALDFELKFSPASFSYSSLINFKPYLNSSINYQLADSTLRYSAYSFTPIEKNTPLVAIRFNVPGGTLAMNSFNFVRTWLNGDQCAFRGINLQIAPPVFSNGITSINSGDSLWLSIIVPAGFTNLWSNGSNTPGIWIHTAGTYSVTLTNSLGCSTSSFITITNNNPLPVQLIAFNARQVATGINVSWVTSSEVNNNYFLLQQSSDGQHWLEISRKEGAGTTSAVTHYNFNATNPFDEINYFKLLQFDFDGMTHESKIISIRYDKKSIDAQSMIVYPNPVNTEISELYVVLPGDATSGALTIYNLLTSEKYFTEVIPECGNDKCSFKIRIPPALTKGYYLLKWIDNHETLASKLVVYQN